MLSKYDLLTTIRTNSKAREFNCAFFFKQWGGKTPKSGGRELNGQTYSEFPIRMNAEMTEVVPL